MKSEQQLKEFAQYLVDHPEQRFWQGLKNWNQSKNSREAFIFTGPDRDTLTDTFYRE